MIAAKCLPTEKKISLCEKNDILISKVERENQDFSMQKQVWFWQRKHME